MADVEDLKIILRAEVDKAISDLKKASREGKNAQRDWDNIAKSFQDNIKHSLSLKNAFSQLSMQIAGGLAIYNLAANAISALSKTFKESVQEYSKASEEHARLEAQIRATGGAAGYTANQLENMATELQTTTKISENEVRAAQSSLLKFTSITGDAFKKATELSLDLAKTMGTDTASAAQMLGRAIENPAEGFGALRRSGIILTESQEKLAKAFVESGDKAKAQEIVLQAVADRVGGVAKAIGNDDPAGLKRLGIAANEAKEHLGKMVAEGISPVINKLADLIERSNNAKDAINNLNAALRGEGDYDSIKAAYEREKKTLEALKASLAGADIVEQAQIEKQIADVEARIAQLSEMLRRKAQTASGPSSGTKPSVQNEKDEKAAEYIKSVNDELAKNIQAIKLRASALGQEASSQELLTQYLNAYVKLIQGSNGLVTENNPAAKLLKIQIQALVNGQKELSQAQALAEYQMEKAGEIEGARYNAAYEYWKAQQAAAKAAAEQQEREAQALAEYQMEKAGEIEGARYNAAYEYWKAQQAAAKAAAEQQEREAQALAEYQMEKAGEIEGARYNAAYEYWKAQQAAAKAAAEQQEREAQALAEYQMEKAGEIEGARYNAAYEYWKAQQAAAKAAAEQQEREAQALAEYQMEKAGEIEGARYNAAYEYWKAQQAAAKAAAEQQEREAQALAEYQMEKAGEIEGARYNAAYEYWKAQQAAAKAAAEQQEREAQALAEYQMEKAGEIEGARYNAAYEYWKAQQAAAKAAAEQQEREAQALAEYQMEKAGEIEAARYLAAYLAWLKKQQLIEDEKKKWEDYYKYLKSQAEETAKKVLASGLLDLFNSIGAAMASGASSADAAEAAMRKFFQTALQQTSMLALNAGLKLLVEGGLSMLPMALGLFALAGISGIAAGAIGAAGGVRQVDYDQYIVNPVIDAETELANKRVDIIKQQLDDEKKLRDENLKRIEESFNTEYEVLKDQWQRGLISTEQYKQQSANLRSQEESAKAEANKPVEEAEALLAQIEAARNQKLSYLATEAKKRQDELNSMSGWDKFWSGRDEELVAELDVLDARIKKVKEAQSLPEISAAKYGADFVTQGPKLMLVGDNPGGRERVRVEPIGTPNRYGPNSDQIIIQISGDVYGIEDLYQKLEAAGRKLMKSGRLRTGAFA